MWLLLINNIKMILRNRQALFWSFMFPVLFVVAFGLFMGGDQSIKYSVAIFDRAQNELSKQVVKSVSDVSVFTVRTEYSTLEDAREAIRQGKLSYAIELPTTVGQPNQTEPATVALHVDDQQPQNNIIVRGILQDVLTGYSFAITGTHPIFALESHSLSARKLSYFDYVFYGILGMGIMMYAITGMTANIVSYRERKIMKRLLIAPIKKWQFVTAEMISYLLIALAQMVVIMLVGTQMFNGHFYGNLGWIVLLTIVGDAVFLGIALIISNFVQSSRAADGMANGIAIPLMFFSGVFFSTDTLPAFLRTAVQYLPLTPMINAMRGVGLEDQGWSDLQRPFLILAVWLVVVYIIAITTFRFEQRK